MNFFDTINYGIRNSEQSLVNLLSAIGPWLAPLAPAFLSYKHMTETMGYPVWIALAIAAVVEILGLSAISTTISFWSYNRRKMAEYKRAPVWIALVSFVFYLGIILTMNVMIDASTVLGGGEYAAEVKVAANGMLTLLSVPAAVILAVRTQHKELLDQIGREEAEKKAERAARRTDGPVQMGGNGTPHDGTGGHQKKKLFFRDLRSGRVTERLESNGLEFSAEVIAEMYGISVRNAHRWIKEAREMYAKESVN